MIALLISSLTFAGISYRPFTMTLQESAVDVEVYGRSFETLKRVDANSTEVAFLTGESFVTNNAGIRLGVGITDRLTLGLSSNYRINQAQEVISNELIKYSASGVESFGGSIHYSWPMIKRFQYSFEAHYQTRPFTNQEYVALNEREKIILGDDGPMVSVGLSSSYYFYSQNFLSARVLYRSPGSSLSSEVLSQLEGAMVWRWVSLFAGGELLSSMQQDSYGSEPQEKPLRETGPTNLYNSINRNWSAAYAGLGISFGSGWRVIVKGKSISSGSSTDLGNELSFSLAKTTGGKTTLEKRDESFKQYTINGEVTKTSNKKTGVVVNFGLQEGASKGMKVDFYYFDFLDGHELIGTGFIIKASATKSMVKITRRFSKKRIEEGTVARSGLVKRAVD